MTPKMKAMAFSSTVTAGVFTTTLFGLLTYQDNGSVEAPSKLSSISPQLDSLCRTFMNLFDLNDEDITEDFINNAQKKKTQPNNQLFLEVHWVCKDLVKDSSSANIDRANKSMCYIWNKGIEMNKLIDKDGISSYCSAHQSNGDVYKNRYGEQSQSLDDYLKSWETSDNVQASA
ncbi:hypothetical protein [Candidatus Mycoplasma haematohominis]|uniref:hypothetical protein n=1 Tax=Candidatus Mycoplasma haematohominis TaxID=1494318 RepID=UPI001C0A6D7F|nr:hypothetical protein [Candidatus Mycoplasma haemohominis]